MEQRETPGDDRAMGFSEEQRREFREAHRRQRLEALVEDMEGLRETVREKVQRIADDSREVDPERAEAIAAVIARTCEDLKACEEQVREHLRGG